MSPTNGSRVCQRGESLPRAFAIWAARASSSARRLRIAGLSGIYSRTRYDLEIPEGWASRKTMLKEPTYFRQPHVERLLQAGPADILLTHDWPRGLMGPFGNAPSRLLLDTLQPRLHLVGHMHRAARRLVRHASGRETQLVALNHVGQGKGDVLLFRWDGEALAVVDG